MAASGSKADITPTLFTDDLQPQWAPDSGAARGKLTFPKLINDPICHNDAFSKGSFLKFS
jgi:hypothetical protein